MFKWKCVLGKCSQCKGKMSTHLQEKSLSQDEIIHFVIYMETTRCSKHGVLTGNPKQCHQCEMDEDVGKKKGHVSSKKEKWKAECSVGLFMNDYYIPLLEIFKVHWPHLNMLHQGIKKRTIYFYFDICYLLMSRDFALAIPFRFDCQTYGDHFGWNPRVMLEGAATEFHDSREDSEEFGKTRSEFFHFFSDEAKQNAATSHRNFFKQM